jgi:hypothetical protein
MRFRARLTDDRVTRIAVTTVAALVCAALTLPAQERRPARCDSARAYAGPSLRAPVLQSDYATAAAQAFVAVALTGDGSAEATANLLLATLSSATKTSDR